MAQNASLEQLQACGLKDIASQLEFQRLIKEKFQGACSGDTDIVFFFSLSDGEETSGTGGKDLQLTTKFAGIILSVAYNAISVKFITRAQLSSASKTLKLGIKSSLSKEEYLISVARALIKEGFIKFKASSENITRDNIIKLKSF